MKAKPKLPSLWKRFRYRCGVVVLLAVAWIVQRMPRETVHRIGRGLGWLAYYLLSEQRRLALANLDVAFGDTKTRRDKNRIARSSMQSVAATVLCLLWSPRLTPQNFRRWAEVDAGNLAYVRQILQRGKGVIFLTLHYGDWELLGLAMGFDGIPLTVVQETMPDQAAEVFFARLRACSGHRIISQRFAGIRLLKALRRGENIALLTDLNATSKGGGVWVRFFGLPVYNDSAAAALALHTGAPIVCCVAHPRGDGLVHIVYEPEITCPPTGNYDADVLALSQKCLEAFETIIRQQPEFWLWGYKRWKFRPTREQGNLPYYSRYWPPVSAEFK